MMVGRTRHVSDKYFRYVVSWLVFGVLGIFIFWQWNLEYALISIAMAFILSFGIDYLCHFIVKQKVKAMVKEEPIVILDAIRARREKKGYFVITKNFVLFVPLFRKIKTVIESEKVVRHKVERQSVEVTAKFANGHRTFSYQVISTKKLVPLVEDLMGKSLPYKYDKFEEHSF